MTFECQSNYINDENTIFKGLAMRILSVRPSVRLSNACFATKWKKDRSRFLLYERSFSLVFSEEEWLVGVIPST